MNIPTKYSELGYRGKAMLGYLALGLILFIIGYLFSHMLLKVLIWFFNLIVLGVMLEKTRSPYHLAYSYGSSMRPSIPSGLTLNLVKSEVDDIWVGDVVTYKKNDKRIQHRIVGFNGDGSYILKGDGNDTLDRKPVDKDKIISKTIQYGLQPVYIPLSPFSIYMSFVKLWMIFVGKHERMLEENLRFVSDFKN